MKSNFEKIAESKMLTKNLQIAEVNKALKIENEFMKKTFSHTLKICEIVLKINDAWNSEDVKDELKKLNITYKDKYEFFNEILGYGKSYVAELLKISKCKDEVLTKFLETEIAPSVKKLIKFMDGKSEEKVNMTAEGLPNDKSEVKKPLKFQSEKKGIEIKVNGMLTVDEKKEAMAFIKSLTTI